MPSLSERHPGPAAAPAGTPAYSIRGGAKHPARRRASKYRYDDAKQLYVEGIVNDKGEREYPTMQRVSDMFEIPANRLRERAAQELWVDAKAAFQANLEKVRQEKRLQDHAKEATEVDTKALGVSKLGANLVQARMAEMAQELGKRQKAKKAYEELVERCKAEGRSPTGEELDETEYDPWAPHPVDVRELQTLAATATAWYQLAMKALGEVETTRTELTGPGGQPLQVRASVSGELARDDASRIEGLLVAISRSEIAVGGPNAGAALTDSRVAALVAARRAGHPGELGLAQPAPDPAGGDPAGS